MTRDADLEVLSAYEAVCDLPLATALAELERTHPAGVLRDRVRGMLLADGDHAPLLDSSGPEALADALARDLAQSMVSQPAGVAPGPIPATLGPYRVLGLLGGGAMGLVYEAEQAQPLRRVAIKVVRQHRGGEETRSLFRNEAQILAALRHPAIPYVVEAAEYEGLGYVVMERIVGEPLDVWARGRSEGERLAAFRALCEGVAYAHAAGVLHRDLKPANILVEASGQPRILDFGLSVLANAAQPAEMAGTVPYLPPEALDGTVDQQGDVYALGIILYELLYDRLPWTLSGLTAREALRRKRTPLEAVAAPRVSAPAAAIARRAAAPARADRYPTVRALCDDLRAEHEHRPVSAWRPSVYERLTRWVRRNRVALRWAVLSAVAVVLLGVTAVAVRSAALALADRRRQVAAWERYEVVKDRLEDLRLAGEHARATAVFEALTEMRENQDTDALAQAWIDEAQWRARTDDEDGQVAALAAALSGRSKATMRQEILLELGGAFRRRLDWGALALVAGQLTDPTVRAEYEGAARAGLRQLAPLVPPASGVAAILAAWSVGTRTQWRPTGVSRQRWTGDADRLVLIEQDANSLVAVDPLDLGSDPIGRGRAESWALPPMRFGWDAPRIHVLDGRVWMAALLPGEVARWRLLSASTSDPGLRFTEVLLGDGGVPSPMVAADLDADGAPRIYLGSGPPERRVRSFDPRAPRLDVPHPGSDAAASDVNDLLATDLDGDGVDELVLSLGAWQAYDVRVLGARSGEGEAAGLELRARRQLGGFVSLARLTRPDGHVVLVAAKGDSCPSAQVFGPERPDGEPQGVYLLRYDGESLVDEAFVAAPAGSEVHPGRVYAGDLDGDGLEDLTVVLSSTEGASAWVLRQRADGSFETAIVGGVSLLGVEQADADPARELFVRLPDDDEHLWVLGAGAEPVPARPARPLDTASTGSERADLLRRLGLRVPAAALLERLGQTEQDRALLARYWSSAAALRAEEEDYERALTDLRTARTLRDRGDAEDAGLLREQLRIALAGHRPEEARVALAELRGHPVAGDLTAEEEAARAVGLERSQRRVLDLTDPFAVDWEVADPAAVRLGADGVRLELITGGGAALQLPLVRDGGPFGVSLDVSLERTDPGGSLRIDLAPADGGDGIGVAFDAWGGGRRLGYAWHCRGEGLDGSESHSGLGAQVSGRSLELRLMAVGDTFRCEGWTDGSLEAHEATARVPAEGERWVLTIGTPDTSGYGSRRELEAVLRSLVIEGARPALAEPGWALEWLRAGDASSLAALTVADPALAAVLASDAGRTDQAAALAGQVARGARERVPNAFVDAMRRRPGVWIPLVRASWSADAFSVAYAEAWTGVLSGPPDREAISALDHPFADLLPVAPATIEALVNRASLLDHLGRRPSARALLERIVAASPGGTGPVDDAILGLAGLDARTGRIASAHTRCVALLTTSATPHLAQDRIRRDPSLRAACGDLLGPEAVRER